MISVQKSSEFDNGLKQIENDYIIIENLYGETMEVLNALDIDYADKKHKVLLNYLKELNPMVFDGMSNRDKKELACTYQAMVNIGRSKLKDDLSVPNGLKKKIIRLCKAIGCSGNKYEDCINNKKLMVALYNKKIIKMLDDLDKKKLKEEIDYTPNMKENMKQILNIKCKNGLIKTIDEFINYQICGRNIGAYVDILVGQDGKTPMFVCVMPAAVLGRDSELIHEMNHIATTTISESDDNSFVYKVGVDQAKGLFRNLEYNEDDLHYPENKDDEIKCDPIEILGEVVNDLLAKKIFGEMRKRDISINLGYQEEYELTSYADCFPLVQDFIYKNESFFKECMNVDEDLMKNVFGEKNFKKLAKIVYDYYDNCTNGYMMEARNKIDRISNGDDSCYRSIIKNNRLKDESINKLGLYFDKCDQVLGVCQKRIDEFQSQGQNE